MLGHIKADVGSWSTYSLLHVLQYSVDLNPQFLLTYYTFLISFIWSTSSRKLNYANKWHERSGGAAAIVKLRDPSIYLLLYLNAVSIFNMWEVTWDFKQ